MERTARRLAALTALGCVLAPPVEALAQGPAVAPESAARADALFARGKADMAAGRLGTACAAFAESLALDPAEGTLLALALCHEKEGELVLAYTEARDVVTRSDREDRKKVGRAAMARIEPRIGRLVVSTNAASAACTASLRIDDKPVSVEIGRELPLSAGDHRLTCDVGGQTWNGALLTPAGVVTSFAAPTPDAAPPPSEHTPAKVTVELRPPDTKPTSNAPVFPWVLGGVGVAALGAGAFFGVHALDGWSTVESKCDPAACRDASATEDARAARTNANIANVAVVAGAVLVGTSIVLLVTHKSEPESRVARALLGGGRVAF